MSKHPYEYITPENYDIIRTTIVNGMTKQKHPTAIANDLIRVAGLPQKVAYAIVSREIEGVVDG